MRIVNAEIKEYDLPLKKVYKNSLAAKSVQKSLVLVLHSDEGITGISSIEPDTPNYSEETWYEIREVVSREFLPILLSEELSEIELINDRMSEMVYGHLMSKSLVETALYDLSAKKRNTQVYRLLGGDSIKDIPLTGWVGISDSEQRLVETKAFIDEGYSCIKYKIDSRVESTIDFIGKVRKTYGYEFKIRLDANQSMNVRQAQELAEKVHKHEIELLEQPVDRDDIEGLAAITKGSSIPIMADESAYSFAAVKSLIKSNACSVIKLKVMRSGGVNATRKIAKLADDNGIECIIGNGFSTSIGTSIEANFYLGGNRLNEHAEFVGPLKLKEDLVRNPLLIKNGKLIPSKGYGFGYMIDDINM